MVGAVTISLWMATTFGVRMYFLLMLKIGRGIVAEKAWSAVLAELP